MREPVQPQALEQARVQIQEYLQQPNLRPQPVQEPVQEPEPEPEPQPQEGRPLEREWEQEPPTNTGLVCRGSQTAVLSQHTS